MKNTKRIVWGIIILIVLAIVCVEIKTKFNNSTEQNVVGVNVYVQQPILEAVLEGLEEYVAQTGNIKLDVKNSNGDAMTCQQVNEQFLHNKVLAIVALGTPAAQSAISLTAETPVIFGAITDPVGAKLADTLETPGGNKTGTTNRWPFEEQVDLLSTMLSNVKRVGMLVNPGEANCEAGMKIIREAFLKKNIELVEIPVAQSSEVTTAVRTLKGKVDVIMVSPANTVFAALDSVINEASLMGIPVFGGDETAVKRGSIATYGFSNKDVGTATGEILLKVLANKQTPGSIPVSRPKKLRLFINKSSAEKSKVSFPDTSSPIEYY